MGAREGLYPKGRTVFIYRWAIPWYEVSTDTWFEVPYDQTNTPTRTMRVYPIGEKTAFWHEDAYFHLN